MSSHTSLKSALAFVALIFCFIFHLPAQDNVQFDSEGWKRQNNVTPPSPDAASLGSYGNTSVNYHSGAASINVPMQGIGGKFLSASLSLSYDASSVKVATVPSWVGLGWTLQAGGVITRAAQGMPDTYNFFDWESDYPEFAGLLSPEQQLHCNDEVLLRRFYNRISAGDIDLQPDVFYFNFPGGSGSFIFDKNKNIIQRDRTDLIIEATAIGNDFMTFTITTVDGTRYTFGTTSTIERTEYTSTIHEDGEGDPALIPDTNPKHFSFNSAWYLISVHSSGSAESIVYEYHKKNTSTPYSLPVNVENDNSISCSQDPETDVWSCGTGSFGDGDPELSKPKIYDRQFLNIITLKIDGYETERIRFLDSDHAVDANNPTTNGVQLDRIIIERRWQQTAWSQILSYRFNYADGNPTGRLTLESLQETGYDEGGSLIQSKPPYAFSYYSGALPPFTSNAIDLYGYYNGAHSNEVLTHKLVPTYRLTGLDLYNGANRNATGKTEGVLQSITYPTGGSTEFQYESHQAANLNEDFIRNFGTAIGGLRLKKIIDYDGLGGTALTRNFRYIAENGEESGVLMNNPAYIKNSTYTTELPPGTGSDPNNSFFYGTRNNLSIFAYNASSFGTIQGNHIGYSRVEEVIGSIGKNVYHYEVDPNGHGWDPSDGRLLKKEIFGTASASVQVRGEDVQNLSLGRLDREEIYNYGGASDDFDPPTFYVFRVESDADQNGASVLCQIDGTVDDCDPDNRYEWRYGTGDYSNQDTCLNDNDDFRTRFHHNNYGLSTTWTRPDSTITTDYFYDAVPEETIIFNPADGDVVPDDWQAYFFGNSRSVTQTTDYEYERADLTLATAIELNNSDGAIHRTEIEYFENSAYDIRAIPDVITKKVDGSVVGGTRSVLNHRGWPEEIHEILLGGSELLRATIGEYNNAGRPGLYTYMTFPKETFTWEYSLLTTRTYGDWIWQYDYNEKRLLTNQIEIDEQEIDYEYDPYNRLNRLSAREGNIVKTYDYNFGGPNEVVETTTYSDAPTQIINNRFDGLGRPIATLVNDVLKNQIFYDSDGRVAEKTYLPGTFTDLIYESSPINRLIRETYPDGNSVSFGYDAEDNAYLNVRINERGYPTQTKTDLLGRQVKMVDAIDGITEYIYDSRGNLETINSPAGGYSYVYDDRNRLISKTVPGALASSYCYDNDNDLMCRSRDGVGNQLSTVYDIYGRELQVFLLPGDGSLEQACDCTPAGQEIITNTYDQGGTIYTGKLSSMTARMIGGTGQVTTNYSLDAFGRVGFQSENVTIDGTSFSSTQDPLLNHADWLLTNDYGVTSTQNFGGGYGENFVYDDFGRVTQHNAHGVSTSMAYNDKDQMLFKRYDDGLQRQTYKYNIRGWLTDINTLRPEVLREGDREDEDGLCEPETGEDENYVISTQVPPSEFFEMLCDGQNVTIPGLDSCIVTFPPEEECLQILKDFTLRWTIEEHEKASGNACAAYGESATGSGFQRFSIDEIFINNGTSIVSAGLEGPYTFSFTTENTAEQQRLVTDLSNYLLSIDTLSYPFDTIYVVDPFRRDFSLHVIGSRFVSLSYAAISATGDCCKPESNCKGDDYLGSGSFSVQEYFKKTFNREEKCLEPGDGGGSLQPGLPNGELTPNLMPPQVPTVLHEVILDNEQKAWYFTDELAAISGKYTISKKINIESPNATFIVTGADGQEQEVTLSQLQSLRYIPPGLYDVHLKTNGLVPDPDCPPTPPGCNETVAAQQQASLENICAEIIAAFAAGEITTPYRISFIQLCDGSYTYVINDWLSDIEGGYNILDEILIESEDELIPVHIRDEEMRFAMKFAHQPNGNIEEMKWKVSNRATSIYDFAYDELDRVTEANYSEEFYWEEIHNPGTGSEYISRRLIRAPSEIYSTGYTYDGAGNILTLWRNGLGTACEGPGGRIDDMALTYGGLGGQQLMTVTDAATPNLRPFGFKPHDSAGHGSLLYTYDNNGNMTYDPHKELDLIYNFLNLPEQANGPQNSFSTVYDATGRKWKKETTYVDTANNIISKTLLYVGAMEFEETPEYNLRLASINGHEDGRAVPLYSESLSGDVPQRIEYYHKDHLGNVRLTFSDLNEDGVITVGSIYDPTNEIVLEKHYYPFGLEQTGAWFATVTPDNQYRFNSKELDEATGLYDYGARYYDPAIARWGQIDPLAEEYAPISPYAYVANNPILLIDPDGMRIIISHRDDGPNSQLVSVTYGEDGKLYDYYTGEEYIGNNEYILNAKATIENLVDMGGGVADVVNDLISGEEKHFVANFDAKWDGTDQQRDESYNVRGRSSDNRTGSQTKFVPDTDRERLNDPALSNEEILGHEFKHAYNRKHNIRGVGFTDNSIPLEEIDGLNFQNIIRENQGRALKTNFAKRDVSKHLTPTSEYNNYRQR